MLKFEDLSIFSSKEGEQLPQQVMEGCGPAIAATQTLQNNGCDQQLVGYLQRDHGLHHTSGFWGGSTPCAEPRLQGAWQAAAREPQQSGASWHQGRQIWLRSFVSTGVQHATLTTFTSDSKTTLAASGSPCAAKAYGVTFSASPAKQQGHMVPSGGYTIHHQPNLLDWPYTITWAYANIGQATLVPVIG